MQIWIKQNHLRLTYWQEKPKITSESTWHKIFHSGSLVWSTNLGYPIINAFLLRATQMCLQPVSYLAMLVKRLCSNFHVFLCASLHSVIPLGTCHWPHDLAEKINISQKNLSALLKEQLVTAALCWAAKLKLSFGKISFPWKISISFP